MTGRVLCARNMEVNKIKSLCHEVQVEIINKYIDKQSTAYWTVVNAPENNRVGEKERFGMRECMSLIWC